MNPTIFGVIGPGFLNQVPTVSEFATAVSGSGAGIEKITKHSEPRKQGVLEAGFMFESVECNLRAYCALC